MEVPEAPLLAYCYESLSHEVRRDILRLIGSFSHISYTDLIEYLEIKPGSFFYHVKKMPELIDQNQEKEYILTEKGQLCYEMLRRNEDQVRNREVKTVVQVQGGGSSQKETIDLVKQHANKQFLLLGNIFRNLTFDLTTFLMVGIILTIQFLILAFTEYGLIVPFFFSPLFYYDPIILLIEFLWVLLVEWIFLEVMSMLFTNLKNFKISLEILLALPFCNLPLYLYPLSDFLFGLFFPDIPSILTFSLSLLLQLWSALVLAQIVQIHKSVSYEKALLPVILMMYFSSAVTFFMV